MVKKGTKIQTPWITGDDEPDKPITELSRRTLGMVENWKKRQSPVTASSPPSPVTASSSPVIGAASVSRLQVALAKMELPDDAGVDVPPPNPIETKEDIDDVEVKTAAVDAFVMPPPPPTMAAEPAASSGSHRNERLPPSRMAAAVPSGPASVDVALDPSAVLYYTCPYTGKKKLDTKTAPCIAPAAGMVFKGYNIGVRGMLEANFVDPSRRGEPGARRPRPTSQSTTNRQSRSSGWHDGWQQSRSSGWRDGSSGWDQQW